MKTSFSNMPESWSGDFSETRSFNFRNTMRLLKVLKFFIKNSDCNVILFIGYLVRSPNDIISVHASSRMMRGKLYKDA